MDDKTRTSVMKDAIELFEKGYEMKQILEAISAWYPHASNSTNAAKYGVRMYKSLARAVDEAGGRGWTIDQLCKMTVMDLISCLATNNVRFKYTGKRS